MNKEFLDGKVAIFVVDENQKKNIIDYAYRNSVDVPTYMKKVDMSYPYLFIRPSENDNMQLDASSSEFSTVEQGYKIINYDESEIIGSYNECCSCNGGFGDSTMEFKENRYIYCPYCGTRLD